LLQDRCYADHVLNRNPFADGNNQFNTGLRSFEYGIGCIGSRHENDGCIGAGGFHGILDRVKNRYSVNGFAFFTRRNTCNHIGSVFDHTTCVKLTIPTGYALALILVYVINRRSFGWTLQLSIQPQAFLQAVLIAVIAALLAGIYPAWRMGKKAAAEAIRNE